MKRRKRKSAIRRTRRSPKATMIRSTRRRNGSPKTNLLVDALFGAGAFFLGTGISSFFDNREMKTLASMSGAALMPITRSKSAVLTGSTLALLMTAMMQYLNPEQKTKLANAGFILAGDVELTPTQAKMLADAYQMALSGNSNSTPLAGDYVLSASDYVVSGSNSAQPFA